MASDSGARGGGGGTSILKVTGTCRWTGYDFAVISIGTGYLVALLRLSILAHGILWPSCAHQYWPNWLLAGYSIFHRAASQGFPAHNDRVAIWASATGKYCDRVCIWTFLVRYIVTGFWCTERIATESGFRPHRHTPPPPGPHESRVPPPPPPGQWRSRVVVRVMLGSLRLQWTCRSST